MDFLNRDTDKILPGVLNDENVKLDCDLSEYIDYQIIQIRDIIEHTPTGQLPRIVEVECENDIADTCKARDRVQIMGVYYCNAPKKTSILFAFSMKANNIIHFNCHNNAQNFSLEDVTKCRKLAKGSYDVVELLCRSIAPSIIGHTYIKKAIICMLLGGVDKTLPNGTRLRGYINMFK
ncbi:PREDICTED: DNA replication licensing factor Mcm3-like [Diuraphis noxia]|uniref:DNA replication licensing factor Mcm3-like n=1 Tax=Diuraphis noxia TaxID=143948 RepID=UPI00076370EA|nr:PREDICTED: DNA replication licensing factor Mcm3-like [Diuraphis noxia]